MKKRGLLGLLLACMVMLGASMTVFAADKVIDCNKDPNDAINEYVGKLVVSGGESFQIIMMNGKPTARITINGVPGYTVSMVDYYTRIIVIEGDSSKKYILSNCAYDATEQSLGIYEFWFDEYTEGKPSGQQPQPQPASQPSGQQPQSQPAEEPGEQLGGVEKHEHFFQWVTTLDPQVGVDGLEQYLCTGCGLVEESHAIPAGIATVKDLYGNVKEAPENGSVIYDAGKLYTISDYLLKKMAERSDVTVKVQFEYQNMKYELTFPAGTDYTPVLTDEETMYGYFGVAAKLGLTVEAKEA